MPVKKMSIGQLVNNTLEIINFSDSAQKASKKMRDKNISSLVVIDDT
jgi:signal-transduction protein with cAMP-binding, CBS, and nucleotidyltransferase domain